LIIVDYSRFSDLWYTQAKLERGIIDPEALLETKAI
jgi:hypothetical protein